MPWRMAQAVYCIIAVSPKSGSFSSLARRGTANGIRASARIAGAIARPQPGPRRSRSAWRRGTAHPRQRSIDLRTAILNMGAHSPSPARSGLGTHQGAGGRVFLVGFLTLRRPLCRRRPDRRGGDRFVDLLADVELDVAEVEPHL